MKQSHLTTPRTLSDCSFTVGYTSEPAARHDSADRVVMYASAIAAVTLLGFMIVGWVK